MKTAFTYFVSALFILSLAIIAQPSFATEEPPTETPPAPTLSNDATLSALDAAPGALTPSFSPETTSYTATLPPGVNAPTTVSATPNEAHATTVITSSGYVVTIVVTAQDGVTTKTYTVNFIVTPLPAMDIPMPPVTHNYTITLLGDNPMNITVGSTYVEAGATISDNGTVVSTDYRTKDTVDTNTAGTYIINYYFPEYRETGVRTVVVNEAAPVVHTSRSGGRSRLVSAPAEVIPPIAAIIETPVAKIEAEVAPIVQITQTEPENNIPRNTTEVAATIPNNRTNSGNENQTAAIGNVDTGATGPITKTAGAVAGVGVAGYGAYLALAWKQKLAFEKFFGFRANPNNAEVVKNVKTVFQKLQEALRGAEKSGNKDAIEKAKAELDKAIKIAQNRGHK